MNKSIKLMNRYVSPRRASGALALGAALLVAPLVFAQDDEEEDVFELSPFTVEGSDNQGYRASATLAGTRIRTDLKDVGSAISVVTDEFLRDTAATDSESLLVYTTGTEVAGTQGSFAGGGDFGRVDTDDQRLRPNEATRIRGLAAADNLRDYFQTDIPWDSYIVDRVDLQRGANSILFGLGSPAGMINTTTHTANFTDGGDLEFRVGSHGTWRASLDYNKVLIEDELAIRVAALNEDQEYMQDGAFEKDSRYFVALKWEPKFLAGEDSNTSIRANYENGDINANRPRLVPLVDRISQWFDPNDGTINQGMGKATYDINNVLTAQNTFSDPSYSGYVNAAVGRIFDGPVAVFDNAQSTTQSSYFLASGNEITGSYRGIGGFDSFSKKANINGVRGVPGSSISAWKVKSLDDPTVFDFYNKLIDGPNKSEWQEWESYNVSFAHNMMDNKLGFEIVYDFQDYNDGQTNILSSNGNALSIDIMQTIPDGTATGRANPNVGRPYIGGNSSANNESFRERENFRFTGYYDVDFRDRNSDALGEFLGRHTFTAVYSNSTLENRRVDWQGPASETWKTGNGIGQASRYVANLIYLGPSLAGASSPAGANLDALQAKVVPTDGSFTIDGPTVNNPVTADNQVYTVAGGDIVNLYDQGNFANNETDSKAFTWQGYMLGGNVVPLFGYREDTDTAANAGNAPPNVNGVSGSVDPFDPTWTIPASATDINIPQNRTYVTESGISRTFGLVVHTPQAWRDNMAGWNVSLTYSDSENFRPDASRQDVEGFPIPSTTGSTKEMGIVLSGMEGRFNFKANHYKTTVVADNVSPAEIANTYMVGAGEGWSRMFVLMAEGQNGIYTSNFALNDPNDPNSGLINPNVADVRFQPNFTVGMTPAEMSAEVQRTYDLQQATIAAHNDPANTPSQEFQNFWRVDVDGINNTDGWGNGSLAWPGSTPTNFSIIGDSESEGWEFELFYQPTDNWNIAANASKTSAIRTSLATSYADFVNARWEVINNTAYGDARLWGVTANDETLRGKYGSEFYSAFQLYNQLVGSDVAELRPWRYNIVTNYSINDGKFSGLNFGGALRWQDEVTTGYPLIDNGDNGTPLDASDDPYQLDINNPWKGGSETNIDLWAAYTMDLKNDMKWRIQLNVRNAFEDDSLVPITVQPDGTPATSRIVEGQSWTLTNSIEF